MATMTAEGITRNPGDLRRALGNGDEVLLTFHGKPYARLVSHDQAEEERAELARLRAEVEALRNKLGEVPAA